MFQDLDCDSACNWLQHVAHAMDDTGKQMFVLIDFLLLLAATYFLSRKLGRSGWFTEKWNE